MKKPEKKKTAKKAVAPNKPAAPKKPAPKKATPAKKPAVVYKNQAGKVVPKTAEVPNAKPAAPAPATPAAVKPPAPKPAVTISLAGGKKIVVPPPKVIQNGFRRPTDVWLGSGKPKITARVWQIADEISAKKAAAAKAKDPKAKGEPATRREVLEACATEGITYSVFSNNFYRWRKFNGLFGRVKKDGSIAKVTGGPSKYRKARKPKAPAKPATPTPAKPPVATTPAAPVKPAAPALKTEAKPAKVAKPAAKPILPPVAAPAKPAIVKPAVVAKPALPFPVPVVAASPVASPVPTATATGK